MAPRTAKKRTVSDEHKAAMAQGRNESRAVNQYLSALDSHRPKRGRKRTPESIEKRLKAIETQLETASGVNRLSLVQERLDLNRELEGMTASSDIGDLEEEFVKSYREAEQEIGKLELHVFPKLKQLLARYRPDWRALDEVALEGSSADLPSLSALSKVVALDLGEPWWKHWWTRDRNFEGQVTELDGLIRREFYPIVDELAQAARAHLKARQANSLQEANLHNIGDLGAKNDHDSLGLFQQRPSTGGWGTAQEIQDPHHAATKFLERLSQVDGWQDMPLTKAAQKVQVSAYPDHYAKHEQQAGDIIHAVYGEGPYADLAS